MITTETYTALPGYPDMWAMYCDIAREAASQAVYEMVGMEMAEALQRKLDEGWVVVEGPTVNEKEDFLRNQTRIIAMVRLQRRE